MRPPPPPTRASGEAHCSTVLELYKYATTYYQSDPIHHVEKC